MAEPQEDVAETNRRLTEALNRHGYGLQYAILSLAEELLTKGDTCWILNASEFPVAVGEHGTRVDFILNAYKSPWWLLAECKRVNPAYNAWCFAKSHFTKPIEYGIVEESAIGTGGFQSGGVKVAGLPESRRVFDTAFVASMDAKGDRKGGGADAIEEAASQICRGMNGTVDYLRKNPKSMENGKYRLYLPVIFTTAELYATDADLSESDLKTGKLDPSKGCFTRKPYLYYQYHMSPGLKHRSERRDYFSNLRYVLEADYIRTIPIVNSASAADFLRRCVPIQLSLTAIPGD